MNIEERIFPVPTNWNTNLVNMLFYYLLHVVRILYLNNVSKTTIGYVWSLVYVIST